MSPTSPDRNTFRDTEHFYSANPQRRLSPEADYGVHWRLDGWNGTWRVSYVRYTGEVYALRQVSQRLDLLPTGDSFVRVGTGQEGPLLVLGTFPNDPEAGPSDVYYQGLDRFLEDWTDHCGPPDGLNWLIRKMAPNGPNQTM